MGIFFVGAIMAAGTLLVLDASLPGGLIEGSGNMRYAQTMAFTTLMMFQLFNVFNARSDDAKRIPRALSQSLAVGRDWLVAGTPGGGDLRAVSAKRLFDREPGFERLAALPAVASSVLWLRELSKILTRATAGNISKPV